MGTIRDFFRWTYKEVMTGGETTVFRNKFNSSHVVLFLLLLFIITGTM